MRRLLWVFVLVVALGSLQPARPEVFYRPLHRLLHVGCFALLAGLGQAAFKDRKWLPWILLACVGFGATLEFSQCLIYRIGFEWDDLRDDMIGAGVGLIAGLFGGPLLGALIGRFRPE